MKIRNIIAILVMIGCGSDPAVYDYSDDSSQDYLLGGGSGRIFVDAGQKDSSVSPQVFDASNTDAIVCNKDDCNINGHGNDLGKCWGNCHNKRRYRCAQCHWVGNNSHNHNDDDETRCKNND